MVGKTPQQGVRHGGVASLAVGALRAAGPVLTHLHERHCEQPAPRDNKLAALCPPIHQPYLAGLRCGLPVGATGCQHPSSPYADTIIAADHHIILQIPWNTHCRLWLPRSRGTWPTSPLKVFWAAACHIWRRGRAQPIPRSRPLPAPPHFFAITVRQCPVPGNWKRRLPD